MKLWSIALCLFIVGAGTSAVNDLGVFSSKVPGSQYTNISGAEVQDISQSAVTTGINPLFTFFMIQMFMKALISGFLAILSILPLFCSVLSAFGIPLTISIPIGMIIQMPVWYVMLNGLFQMFTGFNEQGME